MNIKKYLRIISAFQFENDNDSHRCVVEFATAHHTSKGKMGINIENIDKKKQKLTTFRHIITNTISKTKEKHEKNWRSETILL